MKDFLKKFQKIQWRLTFTYMAATLLMLFLVELWVLVSNNADSFSNPFFVNNTARMLDDSTRILNDALEDPYDQDAIDKWIENGRRFLQSNTRDVRVTSPRPPNEDQAVPQKQQISIFQTKPVPFSQEKSFLILTDPEGVIIGSDNQDEFPLDSELIGLIEDGEGEILQQVISGSVDMTVFTASGTQYASFSFPVIQLGEIKAIVFMRITAPTVMEEIQAAFKGFLPDLPIFLLTSIVVGFVFGTILASSFTGRLKKLIEYTSRWGRGDFSQIKDIKGGDEISELSLALNKMVDQVESLIEDKKKLAVLEERNRFARDLHDSVKQEIFSISMNLGAIKSLIRNSPDKAIEQLEITTKIAKQARNELSALIYTLLPAQLENQALEMALKEYVKVWEKNSGISVVYRTNGRKVDIPQHIEQSIFRITQEALSNIARHSKATATSVTLEYLSEEIRLQISDNGIGFDMENVRKGLGLRSISERVAENQGKLDIGSNVSGTTITLRFPYKAMNSEE